jgi:hypothetical protein
MHDMDNPTFVVGAPGAPVLVAGARGAGVRRGPARGDAYAGADSGASSGLSPARPPTNSAATTNPSRATTAT